MSFGVVEKSDKLRPFCQSTVTGQPLFAHGKSYFPETVGERRLRPLARRRFRTFAPFLVDIRAKKPCVRARFFLLGCQVLFIRRNCLRYPHARVKSAWLGRVIKKFFSFLATKNRFCYSKRPPFEYVFNFLNLHRGL